MPDVVNHKWSAAVTDEGFIALPKRVLRCMPQLFAGADREALKLLQVVLAIVDFDRPNLLHPPSPKFLAFIAGMEINDFRESLEKLVQLGLATVLVDEDSALLVSIEPLLRRVEELTSDSP